MLDDVITLFIQATRGGSGGGGGTDVRMKKADLSSRIIVAGGGGGCGYNGCERRGGDGMDGHTHMHDFFLVTRED